MPIHLPGLSLYLGPETRGSLDDIRLPIQEILSRYKSFRIASQQLCDREIAQNLIDTLRNTEGSSAKIFIERKYIGERYMLDDSEVWEGGGEFEENRQCFLAMLRSGADIRFDHVSSALQHTNFIIGDKLRSGLEGPTQSVVITSANLAPGSVGRHFNWLVALDSRIFYNSLNAFFNQIHSGDFRKIPDTVLTTTTDNGITLIIGSSGQVLRRLTEHVSSAKKSVDLAFFSVSDRSVVCQELKEALGRGIAVTGIIDGDQSNQPWDAVPSLQKAGAKIRYYPGAQTGGIGRMHYKMMVFDDDHIYLGTANISNGADQSLEAGLFISTGSFTGGESLVAAIRAEIKRLYPNASSKPLQKLSI